MYKLTIERVTPDQLRLVYPLLRQIDPSLTLGRWLRYGRSLASRSNSERTGILVTRRSGQCHAVGVVCYRRHADLQQGRILVAEHLVAIDLLYPEAVLQALLSALDDVAARGRCGAIRLIIEDASARQDIIELLQRAGHDQAWVTLGKALPSH